MLAKGVLQSIGETPLIHLDRIAPARCFDLFAKLESFNPGGSSKDRAALSMISHALETGAISPNSVVVESSSGNMAIGMAQACSYHDLRFICVIDPNVTEHHKRLLAAYGAKIDLVTERDPSTGGFLVTRLRRVGELIRELPDSYWPNQYANYQNALAHKATLKEIVRDLGGRLDYLFCPTSTCGTLRGICDAKTELGLSTRIIAVDSVSSEIFGADGGDRLIPGLGASIVPELCSGIRPQRIIKVTDSDCVIGCRELLAREAILVGGSSGGTFMAVCKYMRDDIEQGSKCVMIFPDRGDRYLDTIFSDNWVRSNLNKQDQSSKKP